MQVSCGDRARGRANVEAAVAGARAAGLERAEAEALVSLGSVQTTFGELESALASYRRAQEIARRHDPLGFEGRVLLNAGNVLQSLGVRTRRGRRSRTRIGRLERAGARRLILLPARSNLGALQMELGRPSGPGTRSRGRSRAARRWASVTSRR